MATPPLQRFTWLILLLVGIWAIQLVNMILGYGLNGWLGLLPRHISGLDGILFAPLLHGSTTHAAANTGPLVVLGGLLTATLQRSLWAVNATIVGLGGAAVWLLGSTAYHVGASGLIFGWFGFLVVRGLTDRRPLPLAVAIGVALAYGAMIWGVVPGQPGVSWESHLFGALAGVAAACLIPVDGPPIAGRARGRRGARP